MKFVCAKCYAEFSEDEVPTITDKEYIYTAGNYLCVDTYEDIGDCPYCGGAIVDIINCPYCGEEIPETAEECPYCSSSLIFW